MDGLKAMMYELECSHLQPDVRVSPDKLGEVLDDEFFEFGSSGFIIHRKEFEGDTGLTTDEMEIIDYEICQLGPEAVLATYRIHNKTKNRLTNRSSVWRKRVDGWKLFFHQGTFAHQPGVSKG
ncbi:MAG TPA: DUF4440 domain-containing protein [Planococcus sp. (in: firmicutes)]|nr:DUF4440 domain-containing protein [Planococcus sp. (in: firmicutes)]